MPVPTISTGRSSTCRNWWSGAPRGAHEGPDPVRRPPNPSRMLVTDSDISSTVCFIVKQTEIDPHGRLRSTTAAPSFAVPAPGTASGSAAGAAAGVAAVAAPGPAPVTVSGSTPVTVSGSTPGSVPGSTPGSVPGAAPAPGSDLPRLLAEAGNDIDQV